MNNRICRSRTDYILGGVCSGIGKYLNIDPVFVRLFFVLLALTSGFTVFIYIILWIILPRDDRLEADMSFSRDDFGVRASEMGQEMREIVSKPNPDAIKFAGIGLVVIGAYLLLKTFDFPWMHWFSHELFLPLLLVIGGIVLIIRALRKGA